MAKTLLEKVEENAQKPVPDGFKIRGQLSDNERAHPGKTGWKPRHGQDAIGKVK